VVEAAATARHNPDVAAGMADLDEGRQAAIRAGLNNVVSDPDTEAWLISALAMGIGMREALGFEAPDLARVDNVIRTWTSST
jgi:hypothetical protein